MKKGFQILRNKGDFTIELIPEKQFFSLIWLHGLGDSSEGFFDYLQLPQSPLHKGAKIKLLQAPNRPVTCNGGMKFNSWYDIKMFNFRLVLISNINYLFKIQSIIFY